MADRIELRLGPAAETLRALPDEPTFDFAFIDADKKGYPVYWEEVVRRLNEIVLADARVESVMLAVADGLTLARRLP